VPGHRRLVTEHIDQPAAGGVGVGHGLLGCEGLGGDHEKGLRRVEAAGLLHEVGGVHVGDEAHMRAVAEGRERLADHCRSEVRTTDTDVDDGFDRPAGEAEPTAGPNRLGEISHLLEHRSNPRHHVLSIDQNRRVRSIAEGDVEHCAVFSPIDLGAGVHGVGRLPHPARPRKLAKQADRRLVDAILGVVEEQVLDLERETREPLGVGGEELAHVNIPNLAVVGFESLPGSGFS